MISCNLIGGLGNKMFQIATTYSLGVDNNTESQFITTNASNAHGHINTYTNNIFRNVNFGKPELTVRYQEPFFHYNRIPFSDKLLLLGYFQSEKYFKNNRDKILELFSIDEESKKIIEDKYGDILKGETCSLHVRRGDYLNLQNYHPICSLEYYKESIDIIGDVTYLVFSNDIEWCKNNFSEFDCKFIYISDNPDYIDVWLMSLCKNNIIANSSFSWWGAWLNENNNKKVISPNTWFGVNNSHLQTIDLYCDGWIIK